MAFITDIETQLESDGITLLKGNTPQPADTYPQCLVGWFTAQFFSDKRRARIRHIARVRVFTKSADGEVAVEEAVEEVFTSLNKLHAVSLNFGRVDILEGTRVRDSAQFNVTTIYVKQV